MAGGDQEGHEHGLDLQSAQRNGHGGGALCALDGHCAGHASGLSGHPDQEAEERAGEHRAGQPDRPGHGGGGTVPVPPAGFLPWRAGHLLYHGRRRDGGQAPDRPLHAALFSREGLQPQAQSRGGWRTLGQALCRGGGEGQVAGRAPGGHHPAQGG